jgi:hypothetical protein
MAQQLSNDFSCAKLLKGLANYAEDVLTGLASPATWLECRRTVHRRTCNTDGLNSVTWDTELHLRRRSPHQTTIGKFTDDYMERTKGTTAWKSTLTTHTSHGSSRDIKIGSIDGKAHWTQVEACTPPGRQRGWFQHGVQGESTSGARSLSRAPKSTQAHQQDRESDGRRLQGR